VELAEWYVLLMPYALLHNLFWKLLTDLPELLPTLRANVALNSCTSVEVAAHVWGGSVDELGGPFDVCILSEVLYFNGLDVFQDDPLPLLAASALRCMHPNACIVCVYKPRWQPREQRFFDLVAAGGWTCTPLGVDTSGLVLDEQEDGEYSHSEGCIKACVYVRSMELIVTPAR
jgi:hypothetical protein